MPLLQSLRYSTSIVLLTLSGATQALELTADTVYQKGKIVTVNDNFDIAEAIAIRSHKILAVDTTENIQNLITVDTYVVDLEGKTLLPGFYDAHIHLGPTALPFGASFVINTPADIDKLLREEAGKVADGESLVGILQRPYCHMQMPSRWTLDDIAPNNPVVLACGVLKLALNSLVLENGGNRGDRGSRISNRHG